MYEKKPETYRHFAIAVVGIVLLIAYMKIFY